MTGLWIPPGSMDQPPGPPVRSHPSRRDHLCAKDHCFHTIENTKSLIFCCHCDGLFEKPTSLLIEEYSHGIGYHPTFVPFSQWAKDEPSYETWANDLRKERLAKVDNPCPTCSGSCYDERSVGHNVFDPCPDCDHEGTREAFDRVQAERDRGS